MVLNSKKRALFFSAGEQEMNMNAYEEYKTIIMAKSNTATAARARQEAVYGAVYEGDIYVRANEFSVSHLVNSVFFSVSAHFVHPEVD